MIDLAEGPPPRLVNRSEVTAEGVEFGLTVRPLEHLWLNGHLTYVRTDIRKTAEELPNRPEWRGGINGQWQWRPDLVFSVDMLSVGEVLDSSIPTGDRHLDEYLRVNIATTWTMTSYCRLSFAIDNLFDAGYEEAVGENALTRCIRAARAAVGDDGTKQDVIETQHGRGYRFIGEVVSSQLSVVSGEEEAQKPVLVTIAGANGESNLESSIQGLGSDQLDSAGHASQSSLSAHVPCHVVHRLSSGGPMCRSAGSLAARCRASSQLRPGSGKPIGKTHQDMDSQLDRTLIW